MRTSRRILLKFLDRRTKQILEATMCTLCALCCCTWCMWSLMWPLEKVVAFINRNAYIMMAIKGVGYCEGAFKALKLIVSVSGGGRGSDALDLGAVVGEKVGGLESRGALRAAQPSFRELGIPVHLHAISPLPPQPLCPAALLTPLALPPPPSSRLLPLCSAQNALRLTAVNVIGDMLLFLGKLAVAATCGVIAFFLCRLPYYSSPAKYPTTYLSSPFFPVLFSVMVGFVIAQIFFAVYEMAIDTIFLCFCEDCKDNSGGWLGAVATLRSRGKRGGVGSGVRARKAQVITASQNGKLGDCVGARLTSRY